MFRAKGPHVTTRESLGLWAFRALSVINLVLLTVGLQGPISRLGGPIRALGCLAFLALAATIEQRSIVVPRLPPSRAPKRPHAHNQSHPSTAFWILHPCPILTLGPSAPNKCELLRANERRVLDNSWGLQGPSMRHQMKSSGSLTLASLLALARPPRAHQSNNGPSGPIN